MNDAFIVEAVRTPVGRRGKSLANTHPVDLLAHLFSQTVERLGIDPALVDDVIVGCVDQTGDKHSTWGEMHGCRQDCPNRCLRSRSTGSAVPACKPSNLPHRAL